MQVNKAKMYTGDRQFIDGHTCLLFALGTDHGDHFVREQLYGVCGNLIYIHNAESYEWESLRYTAIESGNFFSLYERGIGDGEGRRKKKG